MNDIVSKYITTAIEIIIFSLLLTIIALFGTLARNGLNNKVESNIIMGELTDYRAVYKYIELAENNQEVTGDDIVTFVTEFKRKYDIVIIIGDSTYYLNKTDVNSTAWEIDSVLEFLGSTIIGNYSIDMDYDEDREMIDRFIFTY